MSYRGREHWGIEDTDWCGVPNGNREQLHIGFHWDCGLRMGNIEGQRCPEHGHVEFRANIFGPGRRPRVG